MFTELVTKLHQNQRATWAATEIVPEESYPRPSGVSPEITSGDVEGIVQARAISSWEFSIHVNASVVGDFQKEPERLMREGTAIRDALVIQGKSAVVHGL